MSESRILKRPMETNSVGDVGVENPPPGYGKDRGEDDDDGAGDADATWELIF
jgi:hypothetical protein